MSESESDRFHIIPMFITLMMNDSVYTLFILSLAT